MINISSSVLIFHGRDPVTTSYPCNSLLIHCHRNKRKFAAASKENKKPRWRERDPKEEKNAGNGRRFGIIQGLFIFAEERVTANYAGRAMTKIKYAQIWCELHNPSQAVCRSEMVKMTLKCIAIYFTDAGGGICALFPRSGARDPRMGIWDCN